MRGRSPSRRGPNPLTRSFESNGPDVKVRGTAQHVAEKYTQLARDAHVSGDRVAAESYLQHAEHYYRIIAAAHQAQQALQNGTADERDDDDDDFDTTNDRFTFRAPQSAPPTGGQPFIGDRPPGEFAEGSEGTSDAGEEQQGQERSPERAYEPREPRQNGRPQHRDDRRGGRGPDRGPDRNNDRNQERNFRPRNENGERPQGERSERFGGERQDRFNPMRPRRPQPEVEGLGEQPALPAFLTAPVRPIVMDAPPIEAPEIAVEGGEDVRGGPFRARRRRRPKAGGEEGSFEPVAENAGGNEPT